MIAIAPMVDVTNQFFRYFVRLLTRLSTLYTEMLVDQAVINDQDYLWYSPIEHPVVAQVGGSNTETLARAAQILSQAGYDQINLNCGCPSSKVQSGAFGACLMLDPDLVSSLCRSMKSVTCTPVTVKCRIGVDHVDSQESFFSFTEKIREADVTEIIVHARKAILKGLTPAQNRTVPPLHYDYVYNLKQQFPDMKVWINGGITTHQQISEHLEKVDGVMIGRVTYNDPWMLSKLDSLFYHAENPNLSRAEVLEAYGDFCDTIQSQSKAFNHNFMAKPLMNLFHGEKHNKQFRGKIDQMCKAKKGWEFKPVVDSVIELMQDLNPTALNARPDD